MITFVGEEVNRKKDSLTKNMHLIWKLSDDFVTMLCFDCHGRVLSEML